MQLRLQPGGFKVDFAAKMHLFVLATAVFVLLTTTAFGCHAGGKSHKNGDEWTANNQFVLNCTIEANKAWHTTIIACLSPKGQRVNVGGALTEGRTMVTCTATNDGTGSVRMHQSWTNAAPLTVSSQGKIATGNITKSTSNSTTS